ncbi:hypothetical protein ARMGADRAFT_1122359 [Armillaria gallica]|uniref:Uncharacterized protein n=1 Tax=Armillaria gallica TaxID=47427 RepID=A0A2H3DG31_ARMGA|nr:hypothetical protein ARMGADRAFT_1122359 [Armillaria gallica]
MPLLTFGTNGFFFVNVLPHMQSLEWLERFKMSPWSNCRNFLHCASLASHAAYLHMMQELVETNASGEHVHKQEGGSHYRLEGFLRSLFLTGILSSSPFTQILANLKIPHSASFELQTILAICQERHQATVDLPLGSTDIFLHDTLHLHPVIWAVLLRFMQRRFPPIFGTDEDNVNWNLCLQFVRMLTQSPSTITVSDTISITIPAAMTFRDAVRNSLVDNEVAVALLNIPSWNQMLFPSLLLDLSLDEAGYTDLPLKRGRFSEALILFGRSSFEWRQNYAAQRAVFLTLRQVIDSDFFSQSIQTKGLRSLHVQVLDLCASLYESHVPSTAQFKWDENSESFLNKILAFYVLSREAETQDVASASADVFRHGFLSSASCVSNLSASKRFSRTVKPSNGFKLPLYEGVFQERTAYIARLFWFLCLINNYPFCKDVHLGDLTANDSAVCYVTVLRTHNGLLGNTGTERQDVMGHSSRIIYLNRPIAVKTSEFQNHGGRVVRALVAFDKKGIHVKMAEILWRTFGKDSTETSYKQPQYRVADNSISGAVDDTSNPMVRVVREELGAIGSERIEVQCTKKMVEWVVHAHGNVWVMGVGEFSVGNQAIAVILVYGILVVDESRRVHYQYGDGDGGSLKSAAYSLEEHRKRGRGRLVTGIVRTWHGNKIHYRIQYRYIPDDMRKVKMYSTYKHIDSHIHYGASTELTRDVEAESFMTRPFNYPRDPAPTYSERHTVIGASMENNPIADTCRGCRGCDRAGSRWMATSVYERMPIGSTRCEEYGKDTDNGPSAPSAVYTQTPRDAGRGHATTDQILHIGKILAHNLQGWRYNRDINVMSSGSKAYIKYERTYAPGMEDEGEGHALTIDSQYANIRSNNTREKTCRVDRGGSFKVKPDYVYRYGGTENNIKFNPGQNQY